MRLLLVEDDPMIGQAVLDVLRAEHYAVDWVRDGEMADTALRSATYDLMLLDLGLPRRAGQAGPVFEQHGVSLNPATHEARLNGQPVTLSAREWAVLEPLISRPGVIFSRAQLEEKLFSWKEDISSNAVEVYIHGVRKKLGAGLIQTVRGLGYLVPRE